MKEAEKRVAEAEAKAAAKAKQQQQQQAQGATEKIMAIPLATAPGQEEGAAPSAPTARLPGLEAETQAAEEN